jgi:hypothetical protein
MKKIEVRGKSSAFACVADIFIVELEVYGCQVYENKSLFLIKSSFLCTFDEIRF